MQCDSHHLPAVENSFGSDQTLHRFYDGLSALHSMWESSVDQRLGLRIVSGIVAGIASFTIMYFLIASIFEFQSLSYTGWAVVVCGVMTSAVTVYGCVRAFGLCIKYKTNNCIFFLQLYFDGFLMSIALVLGGALTIRSTNQMPMEVILIVGAFILAAKCTFEDRRCGFLVAVASVLWIIFTILPAALPLTGYSQVVARTIVILPLIVLNLSFFVFFVFYGRRNFFRMFLPQRLSYESPLGAAPPQSTSPSDSPLAGTGSSPLSSAQKQCRDLPYGWIVRFVVVITGCLGAVITTAAEVLWAIYADPPPQSHATHHEDLTRHLVHALPSSWVGAAFGLSIAGSALVSFPVAYFCGRMTESLIYDFMNVEKRATDVLVSKPVYEISGGPFKIITTTQLLDRLTIATMAPCDFSNLTTAAPHVEGIGEKLSIHVQMCDASTPGCFTEDNCEDNVYIRRNIIGDAENASVSVMSVSQRLQIAARKQQNLVVQKADACSATQALQ